MPAPARPIRTRGSLARASGSYEHARGKLTAAVCAEIARSSRWGLATVHEPYQADEGTLSRLALVRGPDNREASR